MTTRRRLRHARLTLLSVLWLFAGAPSTAEAYNVCVEDDDYACTHEIMVRQAFELYLDDTESDWRQRGLHAELNANWERIQMGVGDPDRADPLYGNAGLDGAVTTISHFWSPDESIGEPMLLTYLGEDEYPNAFQAARALFSRALGEYAAGNTAVAYQYLGMVAHFLGDQTIPTHVHQDTHGPDFLDYDGYEEWMSQGEMYCGGAARSEGTCPFTSAAICADPASRDCATAKHASSRAYLTFDEHLELRGEGVLVGGRRQPSDELLWLFLNVNQVADYFASEGTPELRSDLPACEAGELTASPLTGEPCDAYDGDSAAPVHPYVSGWATTSIAWVQDQCTTVEGGACPLSTGDLVDNHGFYDEVPMPSDADGDYSRIREYSYLHGVRGIAGLFALWVRATSEPILTVEIVEMAEKDTQTLDVFDAADFFVAIDIGRAGYPGAYLEETNGTLRQIGGGDLSGTRPMFHNMTRTDAFGRTEDQARVYNDAGVYHFGEAFAYRSGLVRYQPGTDIARLEIQLWDNDESGEAFNDPYDSDDIVDIHPSTLSRRDLSYRVHLDRCVTDATDALEEAASGSSRCGERVTREGGGEGGTFSPDEDGRLVFSVDVVHAPRTFTVSAGEVVTLAAGDELVVGAGQTIVNDGVIINDGILAVGAMGRIDNRGIIINQRTMRVETGGVIDNALGAAIDNASGRSLQNSGTIDNQGGIFDPYGHYYGTGPATNAVVDGYLLGPYASGARTCSLLGGSSWVVSSSTCIASSGMWLRAGLTLQIPPGTTLVVRSTLSNDGDIINDGVLDLSSGTVNQCGTLDVDGATGGGTVTNPSAIGDCVVTADAALCASFGGDFLDAECELGRSSLISRDVMVGETVTIPAGITWTLYRPLTNYGTINIEETGALILTGDSSVTGGIQNILEEVSGVYGGINNHGRLSLEVNSVEGIPTTIVNDGSITNFGTIDNDGNIIGDGTLSNECGSTYDLLHAFVPPWDVTGADHYIVEGACPPPDRDGDGVPDADDLFPDDANESVDADGDGVGDNGDAFPDDATETVDTDGDGVGDEADAFPEDATETRDSDGDGVGDNGDAFATDPAEQSDSDGDGVGDNGDAFPYDPADEIGVAVDGGGGWTIERVSFFAPEDLPALPSGVSLHHRVVEVALAGGTPGSDATVTLTYPDALAATDAWWFYGRSASDEEPSWYEYAAATLDGRTVASRITDGAPGDSDLEANGRIVQAGAPGTPDPAGPPVGPPDPDPDPDPETGGGCGCTAASLRANAMHGVPWLLLVFVVARRRLRR